MTNTEHVLMLLGAAVTGYAIREGYDRAKAAWNKRHPLANPFDTPKMRERRKEIDALKKTLGIGQEENRPK